MLRGRYLPHWVFSVKVFIRKELSLDYFDKVFISDTLRAKYPIKMVLLLVPPKLKKPDRMAGLSLILY